MQAGAFFRILAVLAASSLGAGPALAQADPASAVSADQQGLRRQKPWQVELGLGLPRSGLGLYYHLHDQWAIGMHVLPAVPLLVQSQAYSLSGRYYFSNQGLSFFVEPSAGVIPFGIIDYTKGDTVAGDYSVSPGLHATLELGMSYRFEAGLSLAFSAGLMMSRLEVPSAIKPLAAFSMAGGWAF